LVISVSLSVPSFDSNLTKFLFLLVTSVSSNFFSFSTTTNFPPLFSKVTFLFSLKPVIVFFFFPFLIKSNLFSGVKLAEAGTGAGDLLLKPTAL
jgi:hypothetical protein